MEQLMAAPLQFGLSDQIIRSLQAVFAQFTEIDKVLVYGSRATGAFRNHSDIDLAVLAPGMSDDRFSRLWSMLDDLPILFRLDVVLLDAITNPSLTRSIASEGRTIYPAAECLSRMPEPLPTK